MYYRDPDGNQIETQVDNFDTEEETNAYMESQEYHENPLGMYRWGFEATKVADAQQLQCMVAAVRWTRAVTCTVT